MSTAPGAQQASTARGVSEGINLRHLATYERILLLQGPIGPFFGRLARFLKQWGSEVYKINFNGGDECFYPPGRDVFAFRGKPSEWRSYLNSVLERHEIDALVVFGDCRFYHRTAIRIARRLGIAVFVFEEGYARPDYITLERDGVNGFSSLPRSPEAYLRAPRVATPTPTPVGTRIIWAMMLYAMLYGLAGVLMRWRFPSYRHHRPYFAVRYWLRWPLSGLRKLLYKFKDRGQLARFSGPLSRRYFLAPLQVFDDAQVVFHSRFHNVEAFIARVMESFAANASRSHHLVFKHHPMDRGLANYRKLIDALARQHGLEDRVHYVHDLHLPTLLDHAIGTVVINSTVGLSSVLHGTPVKTLGSAIYNLPGIVHQGPLDSFWQEPQRINRRLFERFRGYMIARTQVNGSFYLLRDFVFAGYEPRTAVLGADWSAALAPLAGADHSILPTAAAVGRIVTPGTWLQALANRKPKHPELQVA